MSAAVLLADNTEMLKQRDSQVRTAQAGTPERFWATTTPAAARMIAAFMMAVLGGEVRIRVWRCRVDVMDLSRDDAWVSMAMGIRAMKMEQRRAELQSVGADGRRLKRPSVPGARPSLFLSLTSLATTM